MRLLRRPTVLAALGLLASCAPGPVPLRPAPDLTDARCRALYPAESFRAVHAIDVTLPFGGETSVLGVMAVDPATRRTRCMLLSAEGLVLFDGVLERGAFDVRRALAPLDDAAFAEGLAADVRLLFEAPPGPPSERGRTPDAAAVCRWSEEGREVELLEDGGWIARRYAGEGERGATARAEPPIHRGLAARMKVTTPGVAGYSLELRLLDAEFGSPDEGWFT